MAPYRAPPSNIEKARPRRSRNPRGQHPRVCQVCGPVAHGAENQEVA